MSKILLPRNLKKHTVSIVLKRLIPCLLLVIAFALLLFFLGDRLFNIDIKELKISCYAVTMLLPFVITGVPLKLIDKTWCGEVISVKIKENIAFNTDGNVRGVPYTKHTVHLLVKMNNGRTKRVVVGEYGSKLNSGATVPSQGKIEHHIEDYSVGDTVFHLYGTSNYIVLPKESDTRVFCAVCGYNNNIEDEHCRNCDHTLIKTV